MLQDNSILIKDRDSILQNVNEKLNSLANSHFYKKKFLLGEGMDRDKMRHYKRLYRIFCSGQCEIMEAVKRKMEGCLEPCETTRNFTQVAQQYATQNNCSINDAVNCLITWEEALW